LAAQLRVAELLKLEGNLTDVHLYNLSESIQDHPDAYVLITAFRDLQSSLPRLREIYYASNLDSRAAFAQLMETSRGRVALPVVGEIAYVERAVPVITGATILILLYLVSLAKALRWSLERHFDENAMDWIFFHPGWLGAFLGVCWLLLPAATIAVSAWIGAVDWITGGLLLFPLVGSSAWAVCECLKVRSDLKRKLGSCNREHR